MSHQPAAMMELTFDQNTWYDTAGWGYRATAYPTTQWRYVQ